MAKIEWWRVSWRRVAVGLLWVFAVPLAILLGLWALQPVIMHVDAWRLAQQFSRDNPIVALMPQPLKDTAVADLKDGIVINRFGYSIQVPWTKTKVAKDWKSLSLRHFYDGSTFVIIDPSDRIDLLTSVSVDQVSRPLLGDQATRSHYDYAEAELNARSGDVSFFHSRHANYRDFMLLTMKSIEIPHDSTAIYSVAAPHLRGFQFGDPQKLPSSVELLLFDEHDRALKLTLRGPEDGAQPVLTQEQINAIIASIKPAAQ